MLVTCLFLCLKSSGVLYPTKHAMEKELDRSASVVYHGAPSMYHKQSTAIFVSKFPPRENSMPKKEGHP